MRFLDKKRALFHKFGSKAIIVQNNKNNYDNNKNSNK